MVVRVKNTLKNAPVPLSVVALIVRVSSTLPENAPPLAVVVVRVKITLRENAPPLAAVVVRVKNNLENAPALIVSSSS